MRNGRLAGLDGLRAISIALVVISHVFRVISEERHLPYGSGLLLDWGGNGVTVFFAISGFLITTLLCDEQQKRGSISLSGFYFRRAFRILPAYWTFLGIIAVLTALGVFTATGQGFGTALSFTSNYRNTGSHVIQHSWSLSVEEQFYLLWPITLIALGRDRARLLALGLVAAIPAVRAFTYVLDPALRPYIGSMLHTRVDALMIGCWAALERAQDPNAPALRFMKSGGAAAAGALTVLFVSPVLRHILGDYFAVSIAYTLEAAGSCAVILWAIDNPETKVGRVLDSAPFRRVGLLSYSLYLWNQPWLLPGSGWSPALLSVGVVAAYGCAELSYRWVEAPFLRLRTRLHSAADKRLAAA